MSPVGEYTGELVNNAVCEAREKYYETHGIADYMFRVGPDEVVDATIRGCRARYINHCCDPNCFAVITLPDAKPHALVEAQADDTPHTAKKSGDDDSTSSEDSEFESRAHRADFATSASKHKEQPFSSRRVFIYALRDIQKGEELTYDYQFSAEEQKVTCGCRAANCRGTINQL